MENVTRKSRRMFYGVEFILYSTKFENAIGADDFGASSGNSNILNRVCTEGTYQSNK